MGFFQSLKQDLSEAVGELIGEDETLEGVENAEDTDDADAVVEDSDAEAVDYDPEDVEEIPEELADAPAEEYEDELPEEPAEETEEPVAADTDAEAAAMALFDSLSGGEGLPFPDDSNEVDLAEKLAEEAYKAEMLAEEESLQENVGNDALTESDIDMAAPDEDAASLDNIDINKMLESIQGELNAAQEENFLADDEQPEKIAEPETEETEQASSDSDVSDDIAGGNTEESADAVKMSDEAEDTVSDIAETSELVSDTAEAASDIAETVDLVSDTAEAASDIAETADLVSDMAEAASDTAEAVGMADIAPVDMNAGTGSSAGAPADDDMLEGQMSLDDMMAMAEALTNEKNGDAENEVAQTENVSDSAEPEPVKEKKTKKNSRKKKAKSDVSADIGAEDLAGRVFSDETAHLSDGMTIRGNIISDGNMEVAGEIDGNIDILGKLNVSGTINGNTKAGELYAEGAEINGNIECSGSVKIGQGAVIIGDVSGTSAVIAGAVKGNIDVHGPVILADSAIVMGDIRSASVQISNGAAVEGMCSQIYAEVSPKNFFKDLKKSKQ